MAIRLLSNENIDGNLTINGTGTANAPTLAIDTTSSSVFNHAIEAFNGNLTANEGNYIFVGKEGSSKNTGYIGYKYSGTSGSNANLLTFGHWASDNLMNLTGDGKLGIGTESPAEKLEVFGSIKSTSRAITGGSTPGITLSYDTSNSIGLIESWTSKPIGIETSGVRRITIQNNGYVGIGTGTNSVTNQLHVHTDTDNAYALRIEGSTNNAAGVWTGIGIGGESANTKSAIIFEDIGVSYARGKLLFCINNEQNQNSASPSDAIMTISNDGNVGINEPSPASSRFTDSNNRILDISGNAVNRGGIITLRTSDNSKEAFLANDGGNFQIGMYTNNDMTFYTNNTERMRIPSDGGLRLKRTTDPYIQFYEGLSTIRGDVFADTSLSNMVFRGAAGYNVRIMSNNPADASAQGITLNTSGNVGIDELSIDAKLHISNVSKDSVALKIQNTGLATANGTVYGDYQELLFVSSSSNNVPAGIRHMANVWHNSDSALGFYTNQHGGSYAERMRIDGDGYVGIGTTSPSATLHVQTTSGIKLFNNNTYGYISIGSSGLTGQYPYLRVDSFRSDGSGYFWAFGHETPSGVKSIKMLINDGSSDQVTVINSLAISRFTANEFNGSYPSLSTGALIRSNDTSYFNGGNVGIGTTSPSYKLSVEGDIKMNHANAANNYYLWLNKRSGQDGGILFQQDNSLEWQVLNSGSTGDLKFYSYGTSTMVMTLQKSTGNVGIGATSTANERLLVSSSSQYGVNISHNKANSTSDFEDALFLQNSDNNNANVCRIGMSTYGADGQHHRVSLMAERDTSANYRGEFSIAMRQSDSTHPKRLKLDYAGTLTVSGDVVAYGSPSDKRYKENIKPVTNALDKVSKLQGVTFDWKESESLLDIKEDIGFIAQDVQEVLPELVRENEDGKLSLRDKGIVPILVEAIKELKAEIEELKKSK